MVDPLPRPSAPAPREPQIGLRTGGPSLIAVIVLATTLTAGDAGQTGTVTVVDGDTAKVGTVSYRLVGFDTPETGDRTKCDAERGLGEKAKARL